MYNVFVMSIQNETIRNLEKFPDNLKNCVVAFGNFDGVHRGHQSVITKAKEIADDLGNCPLVIFTFIRHPRLCMDNTLEPFLITSLETKSLYLYQLNVAGVVAIDFDTIRQKKAEEFINEIIIGILGAKAVIVGDDFKFGKDRMGDVNTLQACDKFKTIIIDEKTDGDGVGFSSTNIRNFISDGAVGKAGIQLGRPFEIYSNVIRGQQLGGKIGFPTANIKFEDDIIRPKYGVYAVRLNIIDENTWYEAIANFGIRPTVDDNTETLEVHLFDFDRDIYDKQIRVSFIQFIRDEQKFSGIDELKEAIAKDCNVAKQIHTLRKAGG